MEIKADTYPVEANVHFPTDINLLWDSLRKSLDVLLMLLEMVDVKGWRKIKYIKKELKKRYRATSEVHRKKGANYKDRLKIVSGSYVKDSEKLSGRIKESMDEFEKLSKADPIVKELLCVLKYYVGMLDKHVDLIERRLLKGETIPHAEKVFSIFEEHVEWLSKGKQNREVVIGHNVLIATDQFGFILDHHVAEHEADTALAIPLGKRLKENFHVNYVLERISFDRGFYSGLAKKFLNGIFNKVIMPKPGYKSETVRQEESEPNYVMARKKHSAVESNINELEHSGGDRVPDKGLHGFKRYVALGVLAYNLKRLGKIIIAQESPARKIRPHKAKRRVA